MTSLLTTAEAADRRKTTPRMIRWYVQTGRLQPAGRVGTAMLFNPADVDALTILRRNWRGAA
jgi:DNA-binding transcriptional MerR regulator